MIDEEENSLVLTLQRADGGIAEILADVHPSDAAEALENVEEEQALEALSSLEREQAASILSAINQELQSRLICRLEVSRASDLLSLMSADEQTDAVQHLPPLAAERILGRLQRQKPAIAARIKTLLKYAEDTAGGLMTTEFVAVEPHMSASQAIEQVREQGYRGTAETVYVIFVVDAKSRLQGVFSLRDLILASPSQTIEEVMTDQVVKVPVEADQEEVAQTIAKYDLSALPVINEDGVLLGVVTVDDVVDVVIEEATEDAQRVGAVEPTMLPYFEIGFFRFFQKRVVWLILLFVGELLTANVMQAYEADLAAMVELIVFIPLIISSGGNSGSQSSSLVIRALAIGQMRPRDWNRVVTRELSIGLALGGVLGLMGFVRVLLGAGDMASFWRVPAAVGVSILAVVTLGTLVGSLLPLLMKKLKLDPAVSSTPFVASLVDVLGLLAYFSISRAIISVH